MHPAIKDIIFFGAFAVLFALYGLMVGGSWLGYTEVSTSIMLSINEMTPVILENVPLSGELGPVIFGFVLGVTAPRRASWLQTLFILALGTGLWLAYLHLQIFFDKGAARGYLADSERIKLPDTIDEAIQTLTMFANSIRSFAGVVVAAVLGLRFNDDVQLFQNTKGKVAGGGGGPGAPAAAGGAGAGPAGAAGAEPAGVAAGPARPAVAAGAAGAGAAGVPAGVAGLAMAGIMAGAEAARPAPVIPPPGAEVMGGSPELEGVAGPPPLGKPVG